MTVLEATLFMDEEAVIERLEAGGDVAEVDVDGWSPLHHAATFDLAAVCEALLAHGADVEARTREDVKCLGKVVHPRRRTPLHCAAAAGAVAAVEVLVGAGADIGAEDVDGNTAAALAWMSGSSRSAEALRLLGPSASLGALADVEAVAEAELAERIHAKLKADAVAGALRLVQKASVPDHLAIPYLLSATFSPEECGELLRVLAGVEWHTDRHAAHATTDLPAGDVPDCGPGGWAYERVMGALQSVAARHGYDPMGYAFRDLFFVKYDASRGGQPGLGPHRDASVLSFNVLLSDPGDFVGGGTQFFFNEVGDLPGQPTPAPRSGQGDMLIHAGRQLHGAASVTAGVRIVLVGFVDVALAADGADAPAADEAVAPGDEGLGQTLDM